MSSAIDALPFSTMQLSPARSWPNCREIPIAQVAGVDRSAGQRDPKVVATVSEMLGSIETDGMDAVLRYASSSTTNRRRR